MTDSQPFIRRLFAVTALAAGMLGSAALSGPGAGADPPTTRSGAIIAGAVPSIVDLQLRAFGLEAVVTFTTAEPAVISVSHTAVRTTPTPSTPPSLVPGMVNTASSGTLAPIGTPPLSAYTHDHQIKLRQLTSNTTYDLSLRATTLKGLQASRELRFATQKQRLRLTLDKIVIHDDGDWIGNGEPAWFWQIGWTGGIVNGCYPYAGAALEDSTPVCQEGDLSEGDIYPVTSQGTPLQFILAEENLTAMPTTITFYADAEESDWPLISTLAHCVSHGLSGCSFSGQGTLQYEVPSGMEFAVDHFEMEEVDSSTGFRSTMYFTFELFHNNTAYPPNHGNAQVHSTWN